MKKIIISAILIFAILANIVACNNKSTTEGTSTAQTTETTKTTQTTQSTQTTQTTQSTQTAQTTQTTQSTQTTQTTQKPQNPDTDKTVYEVLQNLSKQNYGKIKLNITTLTGDIQLNAEYILTNSNVSYAVEQLNMLPTDGKLDNLSP